MSLQRTCCREHDDGSGEAQRDFGIKGKENRVGHYPGVIYIYIFFAAMDHADPTRPEYIPGTGPMSQRRRGLFVLLNILHTYILRTVRVYYCTGFNSE